MPVYPAVPGHRMAYDRDSSILYSIDSSNNVVFEFSALVRQQANDESSSGTWYSTGIGAANRYIGVIFPELRDIAGYFMHANNTPPGGNQENFGVTPMTSVDTTNGLDGTWVSHAGFTAYAVMSPNWRSLITANAVSGVRSIKFNIGGTFTAEKHVQGLHVYGSIASGQNLDRLRVWHPTLDQEITGSYLDWGDVPRGTTVTRDFRIKNNSSVLTANGITVSMEALTDASPSVVAMHSFSPNAGVNWYGVLTSTQMPSLAALAPGAITPVISLRLTSSPTAVLSVWAQRILAVPTTMA